MKEMLLKTLLYCAAGLLLAAGEALAMDFHVTTASEFQAALSAAASNKGTIPASLRRARTTAISSSSLRSQCLDPRARKRRPSGLGDLGWAAGGLCIDAARERSGCEPVSGVLTIQTGHSLDSGGGNVIKLGCKVGILV